MSTARSQNKLKIYISVNMESIVGVSSTQQIPGSFEYERYREFMVKELNCCIKSAKEAGACEILVSDSRGNGENILIDRLPSNVEIIRSWPRNFGMMDGIDESFDGVIFLGYNASTNSNGEIVKHKLTSSNLTFVKINGISMSEVSINALIAGHFDVPAILIVGDHICVKETQNLIENIEGAIVRLDHVIHSSKILTSNAVYKVIREKTTKAIKNIIEIKPYKLEGPLVLELGLNSCPLADNLQYYPGVKKIDQHTIRFEALDITGISRFLMYVIGNGTSLFS